VAINIAGKDIMGAKEKMAVGAGIALATVVGGVIDHALFDAEFDARFNALNMRATATETATNTLTPTSTEAPTLTLVPTETPTFSPTPSFVPTETPTSTYTPSPTMTPTPELLKNESEIPSEVKDEAASLNELLSSSLTDPKEFVKHYTRIQELYAKYGKRVLELSPLFTTINQGVGSENTVIFGLNAVSKTDSARLRLHFDGTDAEKLLDQQTVFESLTFSTDAMGKNRLGFKQNPASSDLSGLFVGSSKDEYVRSILFSDNADSLGVTIFGQALSAVQLFAKENKISLSAEQMNETAYDVAFAIQASEWQEVDGTQPLIQRAGEGNGSLSKDAPVPVTGVGGKILELFKTRVQTCRVQNSAVTSGDPADQQPITKQVLIKPQDELTKYTELDSNAKQASFFVLDIASLKNEKWTSPRQFAQAILRNSRQLSVYGEKVGMQGIPSAYEVSPEVLMSDSRAMELYYMLCGRALSGTTSTVSPDNTPVGKTGTPVRTSTPGGPTETPHIEKTPTFVTATAIQNNPTSEHTVTPNGGNFATNVPVPDPQPTQGSNEGNPTAHPDSPDNQQSTPMGQ